VPTRGGGRSWWKVTLPIAWLAACLLVWSAAAQAQNVVADQTASEAPPAVVARSPRHHPRRLYLAMWTTHLKARVLKLDNNWVGGATAGGYFGATFLNSYGRRAYVGGLQRTIASTGGPSFRASLGFRLGGVVGYDRRLMRLAGKTPIMPLVQPFGTVEARRIGLEVSYTFVVLSAAVSYGF
jgi:hypothetical protein